MEENAARRRAEKLTADASHIFFVGRYAEALGLFDEALTLEPSFVRAHTGRAISLAQLGRPEDGLAAAENAIRFAPHFANAYCIKGICLHRLGRPDEAQAAYARALALGPDDARVLYNYACYWAERGDENKCREYLTRAFHHVELDAIDHSRHDPDLARFVDAEWFRETLAAAKANKLTKPK